jgi:hypothetical protein
MKPVDLKLVQAALSSNGGGVNADFYSEASRKRLMKAGLIQWKPGNRTGVSLLTLTKEGRATAIAHGCTI